MNIGVIDADLIDNGTRHPNLALLKISGYHKSLNNEVHLLLSYADIGSYDLVYISKVFTKTYIPEHVLSLPNVVYGGTGFFADGGPDLSEEIEHHLPDYSLYLDYITSELAKGRNRSRFSDYLDYSIGFTTRGCFRKCEFCVNKKYDHAFKHSPVSEFVDPEKPYIYLWDDNVLAYPGWREIFKELDETGKPFQFRQGLDLRLMTEEKARVISNSRYHGDIIFAFDHIEDKELITKKLELWRKYTTRTTKLYLLCAYDSIEVDDIVNLFRRIKILMYFGCLPYIMRYENYTQSKFKSLYIELARWCNQPRFFKKKSFRQFCIANQEVHKNKETYCSAYRAMLDFEKEYPDIAQQYFDLRFDEENKYTETYGKKEGYRKRTCGECLSSSQKKWTDAYFGRITYRELLIEYYSREIDLQCLSYDNSECIKEIERENICSWFITSLLNTSWEDLIDVLHERINPEPIYPENIPQISSIDDAIFETIRHIYNGGEKLTYADLGCYLDGMRKNIVAQRKYGENHSKLVALLGLVSIVKSEVHYEIIPTVLGGEYHKLKKSDKYHLSAKLMLLLPIIQELFIRASKERVYLDDYLQVLSKATTIRRKSSVKAIIDFIDEHSNDEHVHRICLNISYKKKRVGGE